MALRDKIQVKKTISLSLTASDWDLFEDKQGVELVAKSLNNALETAVNSGLGIRDASRAVYKIMEQYSKFGAADTEPGYVLDDLLNLIYGDSDV